MIPLAYQVAAVAHQRLIVTSSGQSWNSQFYILSSGPIRYRREINRSQGYFKLDYSEDGVTWENLETLDLTEPAVVIDLAHIYHHRIVDYEYRVDNFLTVLGYAGVEGVDWENLYTGSGGYSQSRIDDIFLFFGETSNISGGRLNNQVTGSSDYLTVGGSAGSETYQAPNNDTYKTADTDYIWFNNTDASQRIVSTAELMGYDLQRTPVKYLDDSPNTIEEIGILKAGKVLSTDERNLLFYHMHLPIEWHNDTNGYGHVKDNRIGQMLWGSRFSTTWQTENAGSATKTIVIPTYSNGYNCIVSWGDGLINTYIGGVLNTAGTITHVYSTVGVKEVNISGVFPQIYFKNGGDRLKILSINNWGNNVWRQMDYAFEGCQNMVGIYTDTPNLSVVTTMKYMFSNNNHFNGNISNFNTSTVNSMEGTFDACDVLKQSLATIDITNATNLLGFASWCNINTVGTATNYDATLIAFNAQLVHNNIDINFGTSKYTAGGAAAAARAALIADHNWTITDGGTL